MPLRAGACPTKRVVRFQRPSLWRRLAAANVLLPMLLFVGFSSFWAAYLANHGGSTAVSPRLSADAIATGGLVAQAGAGRGLAEQDPGSDAGEPVTVAVAVPGDGGGDGVVGAGAEAGAGAAGAEAGTTDAEAEAGAEDAAVAGAEAGTTDNRGTEALLEGGWQITEEERKALQVEVEAMEKDLASAVEHAQQGGTADGSAADEGAAAAAGEEHQCAAARRRSAPPRARAPLGLTRGSSPLLRTSQAAAATAGEADLTEQQKRDRADALRLARMSEDELARLSDMELTELAEAADRANAAAARAARAGAGALDGAADAADRRFAAGDAAGDAADGAAAQGLTAAEAGALDATTLEAEHTWSRGPGARRRLTNHTLRCRDVNN
eukprot:scaffold4.g4699.t1